MLYFVSELLVFVAALTVVFSLGTCVVLLFIIVQEGYRRGVRKFKEVTQTETGTLLVGSDLPTSHNKSGLTYASIEVVDAHDLSP